MDYLEWNDLITKHFFNERKAYTEVLLYTNSEIIDSIGKPHGEGIEEFIVTINKGPKWAYGSGICERAYDTYHDWRKRGLDFPPYVGYLACFVLADTMYSDEFDVKAYYPRLRMLIGEPPQHGPEHNIEMMERLWKDLEKWSREDKKDTLGKFTTRVRGKWRHVGLPRSQTLISEGERKNLTSIFESENLDPSDPPTPESLIRILGKHRSMFEKRTRRLLDSGMTGEESYLAQAFSLFVLDELENWDGVIFEPKLRKRLGSSEKSTIGVLNNQNAPETNEGMERVQKVHLKICLEVDDINRKIGAVIRAKWPEKAEIPDNALIIDTEFGKLRCELDVDCWSETLVNLSNDSAFDATKLAWDISHSFKDENEECSFYYRGDLVHIFYNLQAYGLPFWGEHNKLLRNTEFYIITKESLSQKIETWGKSDCEEFKKKEYNGVPKGWAVYFGKNAKSSCDHIENLKLDSILRLKLKGTRIARNNTFLRISPPTIVVEGSTGSEKVYANSTQLVVDRDLEGFVLPSGLPSSQPIEITLKDVSDEIVDRTQLFLEETSLSKNYTSDIYLDSEGKTCEKNEQQVCIHGASIWGNHSEIPQFKLLSKGSSKGTYIGANIGEIFEISNDSNSVKVPFRAIWKVQRNGKMLNVYFLPESINDVEEVSPKASSLDKSAVWQWKQFIRLNRMRMNSPPRILKDIWQHYLKEAGK